jgi:hypothetical protein
MGNWIVGPTSQPPAAVSVAPSSGTGLTQTFSYTVSSVNGSTDIASMYTLINNAISAVGACHLYYNPSANLISLIDDAGGWSLPPAVLGTAGSRSNSQCTLNAGSSSVSSAGNSLTLNLALTFASSWAGAKNNYLWASNRAGLNSGWTTMGTWSVGTLSSPPTPVSAMPSSGSGLAQTFSYTVSDLNGFGDIAGTYTLINTTISAVSACHFFYNPSANLIYLIDDVGGWSIPAAVLGTAGSRSNSQCTLNTAASSVTTGGNSLTLNLVLTFAAGWTGMKNNYLWVANSAGVSSGWTTMGTWTP